MPWLLQPTEILPTTTVLFRCKLQLSQWRGSTHCSFSASCLKTQREHPVSGQSYLPLHLDRLGEQLHVLELGGGAEGLHALGRPKDPLQQVRVQGPQRLLVETTG